TVNNENYAHPPLPESAHADVVRGMYRFGTQGDGAPRVRLLGSGPILREVIAAAELLAQDWHVPSEIWSVTSFPELARDARECERQQMFGGDAGATSHVARCLAGSTPVVAATDYVRAYAQLIAPYVPARYIALGTDGFGRSDTRSALRRFFGIDRHHIVAAALHAVDATRHAEAVARYGLQAAAEAPWAR
ncbi:UNVERIFIED_CONTAM: pyruvate dehydrogenase (acetyl-transferring), homodimeric type, partial [Microbacterium sp. SLM126]